MSSNKKIILWDLDKTLWFYKENESKYFCESIGKEWNEVIQKEFENFYMNIYNPFFKDIIVTREKICKLIDDNMPILSKNNISSKEFLNAWIEYANNELNPDSTEVLKTLHERGYTQLVLTDWIEQSQIKQLTKFNLNNYIEKIYGIENDYLKMNPKRVRNIIPIGKENEYIIIGDSLESDMTFAINAKIDSIWFNRSNKENNTDVRPTYTVNKLIDILNILK